MQHNKEGQDSLLGSTEQMFESEASSVFRDFIKEAKTLAHGYITYLDTDQREELKEILKEIGRQLED